MNNTNEFIPTPKLELSEDERSLVLVVAEDMFKSVRRSAMLVNKPVDINLYERECAILDKIIEGAVDRVRTALKSDFYEKLMEVVWELAKEDDERFTRSMIALRMRDSWRYVSSVTKKYRGKPLTGIFELDIARDELKRRGLWKR